MGLGADLDKPLGGRLLVETVSASGQAARRGSCREARAGRGACRRCHSC
jgi:hypothetical protein